MGRGGGEVRRRVGEESRGGEDGTRGVEVESRIGVQEEAKKGRGRERGEEEEVRKRG